MAAGLAVVVVACIVVVRLFVGWFVVIPQNGMYPGIPAGTFIFERFHPYADVRQIARGDVVAFLRVENGQSYKYIWRVVGLPGETVTVDADALSVNGSKAVRDKLRSQAGADIYRESLGGAVYEVALGPKLPPEIPRSVTVTMADDELFVMGDNRHGAIDSRTFGPIPFRSIVARKW